MLKSVQRQILVFINLSGIGDFLMSLGLILILKKHYHVITIIEKRNKALVNLLKQAGLIEDKNILTGSLRFRSDPFGQFKLINEINSLSPHTILIYDKEIMSFAALIGFIKAKISLVCMPSLRRLSFLNFPNFLTPSGNRFSDYKQFSERLGVMDEFPFDYISTKIKSQLEKDFKDFKLPERYAVVSPWSSNPKRDANIDYFKRCIEIICIKNSLPVVLTGTIDKKSEAEIIQLKFSNYNLINIVGKTSLIDLFNIVNKASFLLSNDSGNMHIANLLETQSIIFYNSKTQEMLLNDNNIIKIGKIQKSSLFFKKRKKFFKKNIDWKKAEEILSRACQEEGAKSHD